MRKAFIPFAIATLLVSTVVQAQSELRIDQRQANQRERIQQGVASGDLTRRETGRLIGEQRNIRHAEQRFAADGVITPREHARLTHLQNHAGRNISRQRHDTQRADVRGHRPPAWGQGGRSGNPGQHYGHRPAPRHYGHSDYGRHHGFQHRATPRQFGHPGQGRHIGYRHPPRHTGGRHVALHRR